MDISKMIMILINYLDKIFMNKVYSKHPTKSW